MKAAVEDSSTLQSVINSRSNDTPFIIKLGNISNLETVEIPGNKKIMLKADRKVILKCPSKGNDYKHLRVQRDAILTLEGKITLQGTDYGSDTQYALYVENGGKAEIKNGVTITGFKNGNIGPVVSDGELTMSGGRIEKNIVDNLNGSLSSGGGGSVYVGATGKFIMKGGTITQNKASVSSVYSYIEYTGHGGGVYTQGNFIMKGGTITGNQSERNCKAVQAEHDFYWYGGDITDNGGADQGVNGKKAVADRNDSIYYFHNNTNPHKEPS